ncbi:ankyrin repeat-containing domain protein [Paraphoma chrysanthemicola]|nr:ankyrin repeat-containing domain protein [Paraphoma chrysanthemicola]
MDDCDKLLLLLDFLDVLHLARRRQCELETYMFSIFSANAQSAHVQFQSRRREKFEQDLTILIEEVKDSIKSKTREIMNSATRSDLTRIADIITSTSLGDDTTNISPVSRCLFCFPEGDLPVNELRNFRLRHGKFLLQHRRLYLCHDDGTGHYLADHFRGKNLDVLPEELEDLMTLASSLTSLGGNTGCAALAGLTAATLRPFVTFTIRYVAECVYGNLWMWSDFEKLGVMGGKDCLGRTLLHQYLDVSTCGGLMLHRYKEQLAEQIESYFAKYDEQDCLGRTLLHIACRKRYTNLVEWLMKQGASLDKCTRHGRTPLHYAVAVGSTHLCKMLLNGKDSFDIDHRDFTHLTASDYAELFGFTEIVALINSARAADRGRVSR